MARDSRPPGYDMAYQPERPRRFGRSLRACLPAYGYLVACLGFAAFVAHGHAAPPGTSAHYWVIEAGAGRALPAAAFALVVVLAGVAGVVQAHLCGVTVRPDGIETLDTALFGFPRVRHYPWPVIDRLRFDLSPRLVGIDLWNRTRDFLPEVEDKQALVEALTEVAEARAIPYRG